MARNTIEDHPERVSIEFDLARGVSVREVAKRYGVSKDAAQRFRATIPPQLKAAALAEVLRPGADLEQIAAEIDAGQLAVVATTRARLLLLFDKAMEKEDSEASARIARELHRSVELIAKLHGDIKSHVVRTNINVMLDPRYLAFRAAVLETLRDFPEARAALMRRLEEEERRAADDAMQAAGGRMIEGHAHAA